MWNNTICHIYRRRDEKRYIIEIGMSQIEWWAGGYPTITVDLYVAFIATLQTINKWHIHPLFGQITILQNSALQSKINVAIKQCFPTCVPRAAEMGWEGSGGLQGARAQWWWCINNNLNHEKGWQGKKVIFSWSRAQGPARGMSGDQGRSC